MASASRKSDVVQKLKKISLSPRFLSFFSFISLSPPFQLIRCQIHHVSPADHPSRLEQPLFLPFSHFCKFLIPLPTTNIGHHFSYQRFLSHQFSLLIMDETPTSSGLLLPLQQNPWLGHDHVKDGLDPCQPNPPKKGQNCWADFGPTQLGTAQLVGSDQPMYLIIFNCNIKKNKKSKKKKLKILQKTI